MDTGNCFGADLVAPRARSFHDGTFVAGRLWRHDGLPGHDGLGIQLYASLWMGWNVIGMANTAGGRGIGRGGRGGLD
jgi:hypothetical protein